MQYKSFIFYQTLAEIEDDKYPEMGAQLCVWHCRPEYWEKVSFAFFFVTIEVLLSLRMISIIIFATLWTCTLTAPQGRRKHGERYRRITRT